MKILYFAKTHQMTDAVKYQNEQKMIGNRVMICNASVKSGFEDSCNKIVMASENKNVETWAKMKGIEIEFLYADKTKEEVVKDVDEFDSLISDQVAKIQTAEVESRTKGFEVPHISQIEDGDYKDPDGNVYTKKKGPKLKGDFVKAIEKFSFNSMIKL